MVPQFVHTLSYSFLSFFEHTLLNEGQAYTNITSGKLYNVNIPRFKSKGTFYSPYGQWVCDTSVQGANFPTGVYADGVFIENKTNNLNIDYVGGGIISNLPKNTEVVANYAIKDFNIYTTNESEVDILFNNKYKMINKYNYPASGVDGRDQIAPAIFLKLTNKINKPFQFGGTDNNIFTFKAIIWSDDQYKLDGVADLFVNKQHHCFMLLTGSKINEIGNISNGLTYNYLNDVANQYIDRNLVYISNVEYWSFKASTEVAVDVKAHLGILEFDVEIPR